MIRWLNIRSLVNGVAEPTRFDTRSDCRKNVLSQHTDV